jgi:peptidoglycan/xylan/chitin deacetylase (PgdA/CDA1 family)
MNELLKQNQELWDLFTRKEEYNPAIYDRHQRFLYSLSQNRSILEPEVSKFLMSNESKVEYPDDKKFAVCLTHDIDFVYLEKISSAMFDSIGALIHGQIKKAFRVFRNRKQKWRCNFKDIIALEKKYGAKSSFYFMVSDKSNKNVTGLFYNLNRFKPDIKYIAEQGWDIGLHGGYMAYNDLAQIKKEKKMIEEILGKEVIGYRNHFLRFKIPDTWDFLNQAGFKYNTSMGYVDMVGFRNGMCHPFKPFNLNTHKKVDIWEIPLIIMDDTLFKYMNLDIKNAWEITKQLIDTVEKYRGVITILWHNNYMVNDYLRFYEAILKYCYEKNAWMTSGEDIWRLYAGNQNGEGG